MSCEIYHFQKNFINVVYISIKSGAFFNEGCICSDVLYGLMCFQQMKYQ